VDEQDGRPAALPWVLVEKEQLLARVRTLGQDEPPALAAAGVVIGDAAQRGIAGRIRESLGYDQNSSQA
jgi:hypothetical protein